MDDRLLSDLESLRIDRGRTASSGIRRAWLLPLLVLVPGGLLASRAGLWALGGASTTPVQAAEVGLLVQVPAQVELTATGYVVPQVQVGVSSEIVGRVEKVEVREGSRVKAGDVLFALDATEQRVALADARARTAAARAHAATARAQLAEVVLQRDRERKLAESGAIPQAAADDLAAHARSLEEQARAADADVAAAQADADVRAAALTHTVIRAAIDGTIVTKPLQPGDVVAPGTLMARIADLRSVVVEADVAEGRLRLVHTGGPCEVVLDADPDRRWRGDVMEIGPQLNRAKATATVKVRVLDADGSLLPDMAARVSVLSAPTDSGLRPEPHRKFVPGGAIARRDGAPVVFVIDSGRVRMTPVKLGAAVTGGFELEEGPEPGTRIVREPSASLADQQPVVERRPE